MIRENQKLLNRLNVLSDAGLIYLTLPLAYWLRFFVMPDGFATVPLSAYLRIGIGFTMGLTIIGLVRELIGNGTIFGAQVMPKAYEPISIFVMAPGAFFILALLCALQNKLKLKGANRHVKGNDKEVEADVR